MKSTSRSVFAILAFAAIVSPAEVSAAEAKQFFDFQEALASGPVGGRRFARSAVFQDPVFYQYVKGNLTAPKEGDFFRKGFRGEDRHWQRMTADESGSFATGRLGGGYLYLTYDAPHEETAILQANGNSEIIINGVVRAGDVIVDEHLGAHLDRDRFAAPLLATPNTLLTPHIASSTHESLERMSEQAARGVLDVLHGEKPAHLANPEVWP